MTTLPKRTKTTTEVLLVREFMLTKATEITFQKAFCLRPLIDVSFGFECEDVEKFTKNIDLQLKLKWPP